MSRASSDSGSVEEEGNTFVSRSTASLSLDDLMSKSYEQASTSTWQSRQQQQQQYQQPRFIPPTPVAGNTTYQRPIIRNVSRYDPNPNHNMENDFDGEIMEDDEISYDGNAQTVVSNLSNPTWITNTTRSHTSPATRSRGTIASSLTSPYGGGGGGGSKASGGSGWGNTQLPASTPPKIKPQPAKEYHFNPGDLRRPSMGIPEGSEGGLNRSSHHKRQQQQQQQHPRSPRGLHGSPKPRNSYSDGDADSVFEDEFLMEESQSNLSGSDYNPNRTPSNNPQHDELAHYETRQIGWLRVIVLCVLLFATALVSFAIFYNTRWAETEYFQGQFVDYSTHIMDRCSIQLQHTIKAMEHLSELYTTTSATATTNSQNQKEEDNSRGNFPFVSLSHFEIRGNSVRQELSHGMNWIGYVPIVPSSDESIRLAWEEYSRRESYWVQDGLRQQFVSSSSSSTTTSRNGGTNSQPTVVSGDDNSNEIGDNVFAGSISAQQQQRLGGQRHRLLLQQQKQQRKLEKIELTIDKDGIERHNDDPPPSDFDDNNRVENTLPTPPPITTTDSAVITDPELDSDPDELRLDENEKNKAGGDTRDDSNNGGTTIPPDNGDIVNGSDPEFDRVRDDVGLGNENNKDGASPPPAEDNNSPPAADTNGGKASDEEMTNGSETIVKPTLPVQDDGGGPTPTVPTPQVPTPQAPVQAPVVSPVMSPVPPPVSVSLPPVVPFPLPAEGQPVEVSTDGVSGRIYYLESQQGSNQTVWEQIVQPMLQDGGRGSYYAPVWQCSPVIPGLVNYNLRSHPIVGPEVEASVASKDLVIGKVLTMTNVGGSDTAAKAAAATRIYETDPLAYLLNPSVSESSSESDEPGPRSNLYSPVFWDSSPSSPNDDVVVGLITGVVVWSDYLRGLLDYEPTPSSFSGTTKVIAILENECGQQYSYQLIGQNVKYLGIGDLHDSRYNHLEVRNDFNTLLSTRASSESDNVGDDLEVQNDDVCLFSLRLYPTKDMYDSYRTWKPLIYTVGVVVTFLFTAAVFGGYDYLVERRQKLVLETAIKSSAVVSSLFPAVVRDRLFHGGDNSSVGGGNNLDDRSDDGSYRSSRSAEPMKRTSSVLNLMAKNTRTAPSAKRRIKSFLDDSKDSRSAHSRDLGFGTKPIADLFPYCTVMFADISGFTAWSSVREPSQVFTLLESIYKAFDVTAKKRSVFKVETIGDCYVAVTGLPDPQEDHAVIMSKFAYECKHKMNNLTTVLERELGPDTGDLKMRFGLHSGPVTAGVLRGEKSRFQLFGDTVNTAARMESTGQPDNIHCSQATADLLIAAGKNHWLKARDEIVKAKGKGEVQTYWIDPRFKQAEGVDSFNQKASKIKMLSRDVGISTRSLVWGDSKSFVELPTAMEAHRHQRLIDWNVELLGRLLKQIVARRQQSKDVSRRQLHTELPQYQKKLINPIDEVTETIALPQFDVKYVKKNIDPDSIDLGSSVMTQLKSFVTTIACLYHDENPFHNYEHASHVCLSANKLLKRVVQPDEIYDRKGSTKTLASNLHQYTYGITSDPLTQFAIVFSALIHDVDHCGVSNMQLVKEKTSQAIKYKNKSVAEQNSVDLSWNLLMEKSYAELRKTIYSNETEFQRFRNLVVNSVIATDIFDPDLKALRNNRWDKAFHQGDNDTNLKATIVIEHIIQAADVSHTMQHWHIYQKWNERLFREMYAAYRCGRGGDKDPSEGWYKGELWFYDNYVIPLAKKLKECGVFGVASAECLTYALDNRNEWEAKGQDIVKKMVEEYGAPTFST